MKPIVAFDETTGEERVRFLVPSWATVQQPVPTGQIAIELSPGDVLSGIPIAQAKVQAAIEAMLVARGRSPQVAQGKSMTALLQIAKGMESGNG